MRKHPVENETHDSLLGEAYGRCNPKNHFTRYREVEGRRVDGKANTCSKPAFLARIF